MEDFFKERKDESPFLSAVGYGILGIIGGFILHIFLPFIGFILGFALTLKLLVGKYISFWATLFYPLTFAIYAFVYFATLAWFFGGLKENNALFMILGGAFFLITLYYGILKYFMESSTEVQPGTEPLPVREIKRMQGIRVCSRTTVRDIPRKPIKVVEKITSKVYVDCVKCKKRVRVVSEEITPKHPLYQDAKLGNVVWIGAKRLKDIKNTFVCNACVSEQIRNFWKKQANSN